MNVLIELLPPIDLDSNLPLAAAIVTAQYILE
jgi:hypothetical protein